ncbi:crossover junction endodeoxyribonuclease RuvC [Candidatus Gottesmanbacteria bacterium]|nr:crossover junction endodeoxyribonuclease RuvC [Candidatus Gottesmanbacteria bacterium]MBI5465188.1 crossover junction endodeoxyribonuclease RuvC [Candidatus Gottesmanbacteria bacterium]
MKIILGIDPGTATTGYGIVKWQMAKRKWQMGYVAHGVIKTPVGMPMGERLLLLRRNLKKIIKVHKPTTIIIEQLFFGRNSKTAMMVGQARGVVMVTAAEANLPIFDYQSLWVKKKLAGDGHASKKRIQQVVRKTLGLYRLPRPDDAADALALAICFLTHEKKD